MSNTKLESESSTPKMTVQFGDTQISFTPVYSARRKTVQIAVEMPGKVIVTAPEGTSDGELIELVKKKARWIVEQLILIRDIRTEASNREFVGGESLLYLGRSYRLNLSLDPKLRKPQIKLSSGQLNVDTPSTHPDYLRRHLIDWYRDKARAKISEKITYYAPKLGVVPTGLMIKDQAKRWASCTCKNLLIFNWRSVMAPAPVLDYLVVHELCHLLEKSHSSRFWSLLRAIIPEYERREKWLRENGVRLDL